MNELEEWRPMPGFDNRYSVSNFGQVKGIKGILRQSNTRYRTVTLCGSAEGKRTFNIHVLVCVAFIGQRPRGMNVNHKDGDRYNNQLSNLEYVTPSQNIRHAYDLGLCQKGSAHASSKLTEDDVKAIRDGIAAGMNDSKLGRRFCVHSSTIRLIRIGKNWAHL